MARRGNIELLKLGGARRIRRNEVDLFMIADSSPGAWVWQVLVLSCGHIQRFFIPSQTSVADSLVAVTTTTLALNEHPLTFVTANSILLHECFFL